MLRYRSFQAIHIYHSLRVDVLVTDIWLAACTLPRDPILTNHILEQVTNPDLGSVCPVIDDNPLWPQPTNKNTELCRSDHSWPIARWPLDPDWPFMTSTSWPLSLLTTKMSLTMRSGGKGQTSAMMNDPWSSELISGFSWHLTRPIRGRKECQ